MLSAMVKSMAKRKLAIAPTDEARMPPPNPGKAYMLYMHVPFCERLCPYCSFNRYPFRKEIAAPYFENMRKEMLMLKELGYDFESLYLGGGTPTVMIDELCDTIALARENFSIKEVSSETNPNHLTLPYLEKMTGLVQRLSVGVQSFNDGLLRQMDRFDKYGSGEKILELLGQAMPYFDSLNVDMIFNFPTQAEGILQDDLEKIVQSGCRQVTFSPLYKSTATTRKMTDALGKIDYGREHRFYQLIDQTLAGGDSPPFRRETLWTFNRMEEGGKEGSPLLIEEYMVSYDEYPAIGSGSITHLNGGLYINNFSIAQYNAAIESGRMSIMGKVALRRKDLMRYRFLLQLYRLRLDKRQFEDEFGCSIEAGLPLEMAFMRANRAFAADNHDELTLTPRGRYLTLVMYRQFLSGMNNLRDQARDALSGMERELLFGDGSPA
jgi:coproporphyrinogen III oxidase-like Fe-S oxidoreductase